MNDANRLTAILDHPINNDKKVSLEHIRLKHSNWRISFSFLSIRSFVNDKDIDT